MEFILMKKQSMSGFSSDLEEERRDRLLLDAVLMLVFLVIRFDPTDDSIREVSSKKLLSEIAETSDIPFFSIVIYTFDFL